MQASAQRSSLVHSQDTTSPGACPGAGALLLVLVLVHALVHAGTSCDESQQPQCSGRCFHVCSTSVELLPRVRGTDQLPPSVLSGTPTKVFSLQNNYRSCARIVDTACEVIAENMDWQERETLRALRHPGAPIQVIAL